MKNISVFCFFLSLGLSFGLTANANTENDLAKANNLIQLGKNTTNCVISVGWSEKDSKFTLKLTPKHQSYSPFEFETTDAVVTIDEGNNTLSIEQNVSQGTLQTTGAEKVQIYFQGEHRSPKIARIYVHKLKFESINHGTFVKPDLRNSWVSQGLIIDCN